MVVEKPFESAALFIFEAANVVPGAMGKIFKGKSLLSLFGSEALSAVVGFELFGGTLTIKGGNREVVVVDEETTTFPVTNNNLELSEMAAAIIELLSMVRLKECDKLLASFSNGISRDEFRGLVPNPLGSAQTEAAHREVVRVPAPRGGVTQGRHGVLEGVRGG